MLEPFQSAATLVARAKVHVQTFEQLHASFVSRKPDKFIEEVDPNTGYTLHKIRIEGGIDPMLSAVAFDVVNCLRSALDHSVYDSASLLLGVEAPRDTKFPMGKSIEDVRGDLKGKGKGVPAPIHDFLLSLEPYQGGARFLWEMNELRNQKIHRILRAGRLAMGSMAFGAGNTGNFKGFMMNAWDDAKNELTYFRSPPGARHQAQLKVTVAITLGEGASFGGESALDALAKMTDIVEGVVHGIEAETARLLRLQEGRN